MVYGIRYMVYMLYTTYSPVQLVQGLLLPGQCDLAHLQTRTSQQRVVQLVSVAIRIEQLEGGRDVVVGGPVQCKLYSI
jgi:hypothetical protein